MDFCDAIGSSPVGAFDHCTGDEESAIMASDTDYPDGRCAGWKDTSDGNYYWTKDLVIDVQRAKGLTETSEGSCNAFLVNTDNGYVFSDLRNSGFYALCKGSPALSEP